MTRMAGSERAVIMYNLVKHRHTHTTYTQRKRSRERERERERERTPQTGGMA